MGLYNSVSGKTDFASTAYVAKVLDAQVILIIDAGRAARLSPLWQWDIYNLIRP